MPYIGYALILLICAGVVLVAFGKVKPKMHPYLLYAMSLGLVLMTSMVGDHLVGSDIHIEYYWAQYFSGGDVWSPLKDMPQATSLANNQIPMITPFPVIWLYKLVYPSIFAFVPVMLYFVFQRWLDESCAFLASFFFMVFPAFFMELPTIGRQMLAEVFLALALLVVFRPQWGWRYRAPMLIALGILVPMSHYGTGIVVAVFAGVGVMVGLILRRGGTAKALSFMLIGAVLAGVIYFPFASGGVVLYKYKYLYNQFAPEVLRVEYEVPEIKVDAPVHIDIGKKAHKPKPLLSPGRDKPFYEYYGDIIKSGLGFDFVETTNTGRAFRVLQWLIVIIALYGLWNIRRSKSYWVFASGGIAVLVLCLVPGFAATLNITRFIHLSLFVLAPVVAFAMKPKDLVILLIPYFLFTSGFVFEVIQQTSIEEITIPYSVALSDHRMDLEARCTEDDLAVRDFIVEHKLFPLYSDKFGAALVDEKTGLREDINRPLVRKEMVDGSYMFLRSRNIEDGTITVYHDIGCKRFVPIELLGISINESVVYQSGSARVLRIDATDLEKFTIVVIPDTQNYADVDHPEWNHYFEDQTQWVIDNRGILNISAVLHVGDIVKTGEVSEWVVADAAMDKLDEFAPKDVIPYAVIPGNRDYDTMGDLSERLLTNYEVYFGTSRFSGYEWYGGGYPVGSNRNNYILFERYGIKWLAISLQFAPEDDELAWAESIIEKYPDRLIVINTHLYMYSDNTRSCEADGDKQHPSTSNLYSGNDGQEMWDKLIKNYNQIVLVVSGHHSIGCTPEGCNGKRTDYVDGEPINQALSNYHCPEVGNGGNGYLRYYTFKPNKNIIEAHTYSPSLNNYFTGNENQFTWAFRSED